MWIDAVIRSCSHITLLCLVPPALHTPHPHPNHSASAANNPAPQFFTLSRPFFLLSTPGASCSSHQLSSTELLAQRKHVRNGFLRRAHQHAVSQIQDVSTTSRLYKHVSNGCFNCRLAAEEHSGVDIALRERAAVCSGRLLGCDIDNWL
jgi:hypothetical protein